MTNTNKQTTKNMKTEYTITQAWGQDGDAHTNAVDIKLGVTNNWTDTELKNLKVGDLLKIVDEDAGESFWTLITELPDDHMTPRCYTCRVNNKTKMSRALYNMSINVPTEAIINPRKGSTKL